MDFKQKQQLFYAKKAKLENDLNIPPVKVFLFIKDDSPIIIDDKTIDDNTREKIFKMFKDLFPDK